MEVSWCSAIPAAATFNAGLRSGKAATVILSCADSSDLQWNFYRNVSCVYQLDNK